MAKRDIRKPIRILPISNTLIAIGIAVGIIIFFIFDQRQKRENFKKSQLDCYTALNTEISGTIAKAFFDNDINVKAFVIYFTNGRKYINPIFEKSLSGYVDAGDSIFKKAGSFDFVVYRNRYVNPIVVVKDTVNCDKLNDK
jgi:hypothetical protein